MQIATDLEQHTHRPYPASRRTQSGVVACEETLAEEVPVALVYNDISHAVMLATPADLEEFALGFSLSECVVGRAGEILDLEIVERSSGLPTSDSDLIFSWGDGLELGAPAVGGR